MALLPLAATMMLVAPTAKAQDKAAPAFAPGQRWRFKARPGEEGATFIIGRLETDQRGDSIAHVSIDGLKLKNKHVAGGIASEIGHSPVALEALRASAVELIETGRAVPASFDEGYQAWRTAGGGVFTMPLAQIVDLIERVINN